MILFPTLRGVFFFVMELGEIIYYFCGKSKRKRPVKIFFIVSFVASVFFLERLKLCGSWLLMKLSMGCRTFTNASGILLTASKNFHIRLAQKCFSTTGKVYLKFKFLNIPPKMRIRVIAIVSA